MKCNHISKAKEGEMPLNDGAFGFWQLECANCGKEWCDLLGMTEQQKKKDREYTVSSK